MATANHSLNTFHATPLIPPKWLVGGHLQTIYAKALQSPLPNYRRELHHDSYGEDQMAYDFVDANRDDAPLVVLYHGLEGSSHSHYAIELMRAVQAHGWHGVVVHFRSCGGVPAKRTYHSGDTREIAHSLKLLQSRYKTIYTAGVSLGGNALAKYLGEQKDEALPQASVIISAPLNLNEASVALDKGISRRLYAPYFLRTLKDKVDITQGFHCKKLGDFDDQYTAKMHGFRDKTDYYTQSQAMPYLIHIARPTLIINAQNDPFLPAQYLPTERDISPHIQLLQPKHGGHCGFVSGSGRGHLRWLPETVLQFFQWTDTLTKS